MRVVVPNAADHRPRATGAERETAALSRGSVHPLVRLGLSSSVVSPLSSWNPILELYTPYRFRVAILRTLELKPKSPSLGCRDNAPQ